MINNKLVIIWGVRFDFDGDGEYLVSQVRTGGPWADMDEATMATAQAAVEWLVRRQMPRDAASALVDLATSSDPPYLVSFASTEYPGWKPSKLP